MKKRCENKTKFQYCSQNDFTKKRLFRKRLICLNHMNPRVKHVFGRVRPKQKNRKMTQNEKQHAKNRYKKMIKKT